MLLLAAVLGGCKQDGTKDKGKNPENDGSSGIGVSNGQNSSAGDEESVWFDELFTAYYPAQLEGKVEVIFSKAYLYGDAQTKQPVMCLCSKPITDISLFAVDGGIKGEELYKVERLEPMEVIWIFPELAIQGSPNIGISFLDEAGNRYSYTLCKNEAGNEVIVETFEG